MNSSIQRRTLLRTGLAFGATTLTGLSVAQAVYPSRPVKIVVGLPPGGVVDATLRMLTNTMQPNFPQPLVIENKPGGSFALAMATMAQTPADGYTLTYVITATLSAQAVLKRYDMFKSLTPLVLLGSTDYTLAVGGKSPYKTIHELIAFGKGNPGKLSYASAGIGTLEHLAMANFCKAYGIDAVHVPFKGGPEIVQALATNQVDFSTLAAPFILQFGPKGMLRALVLLNTRKNEALPDVATIASEKLNISRTVSWGGLAAPVGTPKEILQYLERVILTASADPELQKKYAAVGLMPTPEGAAEFGKIWVEDWAWIQKAAAEAKLETN